MSRTVKVNLEADVAGFLGPVLEADKATGALDKKVEALDRDVDKLGRDSVKAGAEVGVLGAEAKKTADSTDKLGAKSKDTTGSLKLLGIQVQDTGDKLALVGGKHTSLDVVDKKLKDLRQSAKDLANEFNKTGDVSVFAKLGQTNKDVAALSKLRKSLTNAIEGGASDAGGSPQMMQIGAGIGAVLAIPIIASIGGAIAAVAGAGIAGLGVGGAVLGNPDAFKADWSAALGSVKKDFLDATAPFTGVTLDAIRTIGPLIASWHLKEAFAPAVKFVPELVKGVEGFATGIEHGVANLVGKAGPAVTALSEGLTQLGISAGRALNSISDGAKGGAQALHATTTDVSLLVEGFGKVVEGAEKAYGFIHDHPIGSAIATGGMSLGITAWDLLSRSVDGAHTSITATAAATAAAVPDFAALTTEVNKATASADTLAAAMVNKVFNGLMGLDQATLHWHESLTTLAGSITKGKDAINENTAAGQKNVSAILGAVQANMQLYQAQVSAGMGAGDAAKIYDDNTAALERQLRKAGLTAAQIDDLVGKYRGIPKKVDTDIAMNGLTAAINDLDNLIRQLNGLPPRKDITIYTHTGTVGGKESGNLYSGGAPPTSKKKVQFNAAGGYPDPGWGWAGEQGPELVNWSGREQVFSAPESRSMLANSRSFAGPSSTGMSGTLVLEYRGPTSGLDALHLGWLAEQSRQGNLQIHSKSVVA